MSATGEHPRVRTYHARRGRLTSLQRDALGSLSERWSLAPSGPALSAPEVFGRRAPLVVDIGCGMGDSVRAQAAAEPGVDVIAIDVHTRGVATLLRAIDGDGLMNVRVVLGDAVTFIDQRLPPASLAGARIFFPDPWPKARHAKRRLVQAPFVTMLTSRLESGAFVHCATDDPEYAQQMREVFSAQPRLTLEPGKPLDIKRPVTKYECRAHRLGRPVVDLWATRTLSP